MARKPKAKAEKAKHVEPAVKKAEPVKHHETAKPKPDVPPNFDQYHSDEPQD